jgi:hypothetical protein
MPAAELEVQDSANAEATLVRSWRREALMRAGYPRGAAERLADLQHVDLHLAVDLVRNGCAPETAEQILV